jgi:hypothetical protein
MKTLILEAGLLCVFEACTCDTESGSSKTEVVPDTTCVPDTLSKRSKTVRVQAFYWNDTPNKEYCQFLMYTGSDRLRSNVLCQLLFHYAQSGMTLGELSDLLGQPAWIEKSITRPALNNELYYAQLKEFIDPYISCYIWRPVPSMKGYIELELRVPEEIRDSLTLIRSHYRRWHRGRNISIDELYQTLAGKSDPIFRKVEILRINIQPEYVNYDW